MKINRQVLRTKALGLFCGTGLLFQFGGCELGTISATTTIDFRDALITLIRGAILTPIDAFITEAVNEAFDGNDN